MRLLNRVLISLAALCAWGLPPTAALAARCGERITLATHGDTRSSYAYGAPAAGQAAQAVLLLLAGGNGHLRLDAQGCPRALTGNSLVRSLPLFQSQGYATALLDAPSDHEGEDGLGGFRTAPEHAQDLGRVITDLRQRSGGLPVWVIGTSRGAISAAHAASRLQGHAAPDGVVLTSPVTAGNPRGSKAWVAQSVFDLPLEAITMPLLVIGHAQDKCLRSPASENARILARVASVRKQLVQVEGGPGRAGLSAVEACEGRSPHGFVEQEAEVAAGIARFIRGGRY
ncbi:MAG: alpha/beta hydrolase [Hylemonella sp.]|uniref:alpha/beta hydrolase n=1 Tax=Hylemonella sp. TaxID=2066020 RepID=UPI0022C4E649|nr:alpha/beta hydrolase [Hylemonella sp.]MCZ8251376.1 alpha/beta hydrolase [Hylemonella sp.]